MLWTKISVAASVVAVAAGIGLVTPEAFRAGAEETAAQKKEPKVDPTKPVDAAAEEALVVNGLLLVLVPNYEITLRKGARTITPPEGAQPESQATLEDAITFTCDILEDRGQSLRVDIYSGQHVEMIFQKADVVSKKAVLKWPKLRWENAIKEPLDLSRDRCCDLYDHVFLKGPDGKLLPARKDNRARNKHAGQQFVRIDSGKADRETFDLWHWVVKPEQPGEYTLWIEFEQSLKLLAERQGGLNGVPGKNFWQGKVRSNAVKVVIAGHAKDAKAGMGSPGAPDEATARKLALEYLAKHRPAVKPAGVQAFAVPGGGFWMVEYRDAQSRGPMVSPGPCVWVNAKTGEVSEQAPPGAPARM